MHSTKNKMQNMQTKVNYFKSNNIFKTLTKMNDVAEKKKKGENGARFEFNPLKVLAKGQYGNLYLAYSK